MKKSVIYLIVLLSIFLSSNKAFAVESEVKVIYFYTPTCSTCQKLTSFFDDLNDKYDAVKIQKYNITDLKNKSLQDKYNKAYNVSVEDEGIVPVVFVRDTYLTGEKLIKQNLENLILKNEQIDTLEIYDNTENHESDIKQFMGFKTISIFIAGLVNGINPCSMSMLLFFLSLIMVKKVNIMKIGLAFSLGKFFTYLFLGTIFFSVLSKLNISWLHTALKVIMLAAIVTIIIFNLQDFFAAKNEKYSKIKVQLPTSFRKFNHKLIKKLSNVVELRLFLLISFTLGILISLGEFLCTGQIYLATIVTILQTSPELNLQAFIYLIIYVFAFVVPLIILTLIIYKGKEVFEVSEIIRKNLHIIKIINVSILLIFGIFTLLYF